MLPFCTVTRLAGFGRDMFACCTSCMWHNTRNTT